MIESIMLVKYIKLLNSADSEGRRQELLSKISDLRMLKSPVNDAPKRLVQAVTNALPSIR